MKVSESIEIDRPANIVWSVVSDIGNSINHISSILDIEVLNRPAGDLVGFKWKETRNFMGKEASEIMWITDAEPNQYYVSRAESNGSIYTSRISLEDSKGGTRLKMSFHGEAQTRGAKFLTFLFKSMIVKSLKSEMARDLLDIKNHIEKS